MRPPFILHTQKLAVRVANQPICEQLNLEITPGECWGILGQNGSGKTTLLHTLAGLLAPDQGDIFLAEKKLSYYPAKKRAQLLGLLFQNSQAVFPQTVWEYCLAGRYPHFVSFLESHQDKTATQQALTTMQLDQKLTQNILTLSGGEWRRLALAALLAQNPALYLLDEPLNHLDLRQQRQLLHYFQEQRQQKKISVLMALHDINIAEHYCDHILMIQGNGKTRSGLKTDLLTEDYLSELYGYPLQSHTSNGKKWWLS